MEARNLRRIRLRPEGAPVSSFRGPSYTALSGSGGMIAAIAPRSTGAEPHESALSGLDEGTLESRPGKVDLGHRLAVHFHPALGDQASGLAGRGDSEVIDEQRRQVDLISVREGRLGHLLGSLVLAHDPGEVLLGVVRSFAAVLALDDSAGQSELRLHRLALRRVAVEAEPPPWREQFVRDRHGLSEQLCGELVYPAVVPDRLRHPVAA